MKLRKLSYAAMILLVAAACTTPQTPENGTEATSTPSSETAMEADGCSNAFFPVEEGTTYVYNQIEGNTSTEYSITYQDVSPQGFTQVIEEDDQTVSVEWECTENGLVPRTFFETDFIELEGVDFDVETSEISGYLIPPADELEVGTEWDLGYTITINASFEGNEFTAEGSLDLNNMIAAQESITVPADTYENAFRVEQDGTFSGSFSGIELDQPITQTYWFVEGIGMVRNTFNVQGQEYSLELVEIR